MLSSQENDKEEGVSIEKMSASIAQNDFGLNEGEFDRSMNVYQCPD